MSNKDDFISRRDAIEEISEHGTIWMSYTDDMSACEIAMEAISNAKDTMIRIIKGLPAVQIEHDCALKEFGDCSYSETGCSDCAIKEKIRNALSIQPKRNRPHWIPCDERLPENDERVLICGVRGGIAIARKAIGNPVLGEYVFWVQGNKIMTADAWMPLPPSYKENK